MKSLFARLLAIGALADGERQELARLIAAYEEQTQFRRAMQRLKAEIAHEMRNPLNAASLQLALLDHGIEGRPELRAPLHQARQELVRLSDVLDDMLGETRSLVLELADHDLIVIGRSVIDEQRETARSRNVQLQLSIEAESVVARVDSAKIHDVMRRLVRNGLEAVSPGGSVHLAIATGVDEILLRVDDDRCGGTVDLGMHAVHAIVAMHDGKVERAVSVQGARYEITIPARWARCG